MKDQPLLADGDINDEDEEMVNVDLNEADKFKTYLKAKSKVSRGNKVGYNTTETDQYGQLKKQQILDKYDMEEEEKMGMTLNLKSNKLKAKNKTFTDDRFDGGDRNEMTTKKIFRSDFEIQDDQFNLGASKKFKKGKKRNNKKSRKILENMEELLADEPGDNENGDLKTREQRLEERQDNEKRLQQQQEGKELNYKKAVLKANLKTNQIHNGGDEDEDYELIQKSIEKQRKLLAAKKNGNADSNKTKKAEEALLSLLSEANEEQSHKNLNDSEFVMPAKREPVKSKLMYLTCLDQMEITDISELSKSSIQTEKDRQTLATIL
jgi:U4/U6.U5 tri-snRNP-associated protein 1